MKPDYESRQQDCEIGRCGHESTEIVSHPQRGRLSVCPRHATHVSHLRDDYFPTGGTA